MGIQYTPTACELYFLPVQTRVPLKFGHETLTSVICARVHMTVADGQGKTADGWGETPLSVQWAWPGELSYQQRCETMLEFCRLLNHRWHHFDVTGHPLEIGHDFQKSELVELFKGINQNRPVEQIMPWLAALICCSAFDIALHDACGRLAEKDIYQLYSADAMNRDLAAFLTPAEKANVSFHKKYPTDFLIASAPTVLPAWHLVGGLDPLTEADLTGSEPRDGYPVLLDDWIDTDGLTCLKVKLRGNDAAWDYARLTAVGRMALARRVVWLSTDFNCTVTDPVYVNDILDRLLAEHPDIYKLILYVEQPFPYDIEENQIDVHSVSARKPLFMDESAHDWELIRMGRSLGWSGVALKTCKTQTGAIFSLCWAKAHGMPLMVQDLTNPMLAAIPHVRLAAHTGTIMGIETNAMQFYPDASAPEAAVHPGLYRRRNGTVDLSTIKGSGFGYRLGEINRTLPGAEAFPEQ